MAVGFGCYEQMPFRFLGLDALFSGLRELIVLAEEDAEAERIRVARAGVSLCKEVVVGQVARLRAKYPGVRFPVVTVRTRAMLLHSMASIEEGAI
jgi:hypothetical protein